MHNFIKKETLGCKNLSIWLNVIYKKHPKKDSPYTTQFKSVIQKHF